MLCSVVTCYLELLRGVQCCNMLHCIVAFCAAVLYVVMYSSMLCMLLHVTKSNYMMCSVVRC